MLYWTRRELLLQRGGENCVHVSGNLFALVPAQREDPTGMGECIARGDLVPGCSDRECPFTPGVNASATEVLGTQTTPLSAERG